MTAAVWVPPAEQLLAGGLQLCGQVVASSVDATRVEARGVELDDDFYLADWAAPGRSAWRRPSTWQRGAS